jgi:hypothetical protein
MCGGKYLMDFITIFTTASITDADLVRSRLEAAGFHPAIQHDIIAGVTFGGPMNAAFPVIVQVPESEAADAREFLSAPVE